MQNRVRVADIETMMMNQWMGQALPHAGLLEQRILELESMGLVDSEEDEGGPSNLRQYAIASLQHSKPHYFVTFDDEILLRREALEVRFGLTILSVFEAMLLFKEIDGPPN